MSLPADGRTVGSTLPRAGKPALRHPDAMTRLSEYLLPTESEAPADAEAISHKLMVRAGLIRQIGAGMWTWLPAGWRVHQRAVAIIREEIDAIGGQEMLMPVLQPAELWQRSGRYAIDELFKLHDRKGSELVLAMTHEEAVTTHVAQLVRSYRDLPLILYHFQVKERDEPRPRAGVLRTREFMMKDSYSFDRDLEGLEERYRAARGRVRPHDAARRAALLSRRGRRRDDGRLRRARVHGSVRGGRERGRALGRLRGQHRDRERRTPAGGAARRGRGSRARRHPGPHDRRRCGARARSCPRER